MDINFIPKEVLGDVVQSLIEQLIRDPSKFSRFASIIRDLLSFQPLETWTQELLNLCASVVTFPWMSYMETRSDLRIPEKVKTALIDRSSKVEGGLEEEDFADAVHVISVLQKNVALKWRLKVLKHIWSNSNNDGLKRCLVINSPKICLNFGSTFVYEIMTDTLNGNNKKLIVALARTTPKLICSLSKSAFTDHKTDELKCSVCDEGRKNYLSSSLEEKYVDLMMKMTGMDTDVRTEVLVMLPPMAAHTGFTRATASLWMTYMDETNQNCYLKFTGLIKHLIGEEDGVNSVVMSALKSHAEELMKNESNLHREALCRSVCFI